MQTAKFCGECGSANGTGQEEIAKSVRKFVSVLFADIKGSTRAISDVDAEKAAFILRPLLATMTVAVQEHGGTVLEIRGDGIYASFGAVDTTEDHAHAACRAAIEIKRRLKQAPQPGLPVRIGVHTGEVVVMLASNGSYSLTGSTVHLAARLEQAAEPNTILVSDNTHRAIAKLADARPRGRLSFKGFERPTETWELLGVGNQSRWKARATAGLSPFQGRQSALARLRALVESVEKGMGGTICVTGDAGIGKSRLVHEAITPNVLAVSSLWEADTELASRHSPYAVARSLVRQWLGVAEHTGRVEVGERLSVVIKQFNEVLGGCETAIRALLNLDVKQTGWSDFDLLYRREQLASSFVEVCLLQSRQRPLLIVVDDLQWCDYESVQVLARLSQDIADKPIALMMMRRPLTEPVTHVFSAAQEITLTEFSGQETAAFLASLLGDDPTVDPLKPLVTKLTGGLPLFVEESVRHLVDKGVLVGGPGAYRCVNRPARIDVPDTIQAITTSRISGLPLEAQRMVVAISVIGRRFPISLIPAITDLPDARVRQLFEILCERHVLIISEEEAGTECEFRHEYFREAAYAMSLQSERKHLHMRAMRAAELIFHNRLTDWLGFLSHHALMGELHNEGLRYSSLAAQQALNSSSYRAALEYCEQALGHLDKLPRTKENAEKAIDIRLLVRVAAGGTSDLAAGFRHLDQAIKQATELGDMPRRLLGTIHRTWALNFAGSAIEAIQSGEAGLNLAEALGIPASEVLARFSLAQALYAHADYKRAAQTLGPAIDWLSAGHESEQIGTAGTTLVLCYTMRTNAFATLGRFAEASSEFARLSGLVARTNRIYDQVSARYSEGLLALYQGAYDSALGSLEAGYATCNAAGINLFQPVIASLLGTTLTELGRPKKATVVLRAGLQTAESLGHSIARSANVVALAAAELAQQNCADALRLAGEAKSAARDRGHRNQEITANRVLAQCFIALDPTELDRPTYLLREAIDLAEEIGAVPSVLSCYRVLLNILVEGGHTAQAREECDRAIAIAEASNLTTHAAKIRLFMQRLSS